VAFRVGAKDAEVLERTFAPRAMASDISGLPNFSALVRCSGGATANVPFTLRTRPLAPGDPRLGGMLRDLACLKAGVRGGVVDATLAEALGAFRDAAEDPRDR
jgi:hypothetical protein